MKRTEYETSVFRWGSAKPWLKGQRVSHKDAFAWSDVTTDGAGNVLEIPILRGKPCFGRIEYLLRHGRSKEPPRMIRGQIMEPITKCGRPCPVREACVKLCTERINNSPEIVLAIKAWRTECNLLHNGTLKYTGPVGFSWTAVLKAIAARGPFENVNDARLIAEEAEKERRKVEKWREDKRRWRKQEREERALLHQPPTEEFLVNAEAAQLVREQILLSVAGKGDLPACIAKIRPVHADLTAKVTANAWFVATIQRAMGLPVRPGTVARIMVERGLNVGIRFATLKARVANDLRRAEVLEELQIWETFDPDADVDKLTPSDDQAGGEWCSKEAMEELIRKMEEEIAATTK